MKNLFIALLLVICTCSLSVAGNIATVLVPAECKTIQSATYSSGGGKKMVVYAKIHCIMDDGSDVLFLAYKISASGMMGFGRWTLPERINIIRSNKLKNKAEWK